ncbi:MAG TPA: hypothetical protein VGB59_09565 [Allosphingosinicella sp.]|jgi:hypothetical protein
MIVALLLVIILILLFGAGVVKGWIANIVGFGCGGLVILVALLWLGSFFGEYGIRYVMWGVLGLLMLLALIGIAFDPNKQESRRSDTASAPVPLRQYEAPVPKPPSLQQKQAREKSLEKVWGWYANDIALRFSPEARAKAHALYDANDVLGLDRFCRQEVARLEK